MCPASGRRCPVPKALPLAVWLVLSIGLPTIAQEPLTPLLIAPQAATSSKHSKHKTPDKPEIVPGVEIPTAPLGFAPPAVWYLGQRVSLVSLNFLDEESLLFTFRVPGLIARNNSNSSATDESSPSSRHIRAVVLQLPSGKVSAESLWELHDSARYLWPLKGGRFLLRDRNTVQMGDTSLNLNLFLRFPGPISQLELPPDQSLILANTSEPPARESPNAASGESKSDARPSTAAASLQASSDAGTGQSSAGADASPSANPSASPADNPPVADQELLRILRMDTRSVMLFSRVSGPTHVPVDGEGYYEALRGKGNTWAINYQGFRGSSTLIGSVESACFPALEAVAPGIVLSSACIDGGGRRLSALSRSAGLALNSAGEKNKRHLWDAALPPTRVWPLVAASQDGRRIVRATLDVTHPIGIGNPLDREDIRGQVVQVYDLATGKSPLTVPATPPLDAGGNFALSPSGKRLAVLNAGAIQVYDLPAPPDLPSQAIAAP